MLLKAVLNDKLRLYSILLFHVSSTNVKSDLQDVDEPFVSKHILCSVQFLQKIDEVRFYFMENKFDFM